MGSNVFSNPSGNSSVILIELNELSPSLMDRFIQAGELPNFARFRREAQVYTTDAEEKPPFLEPWIQWITVHTGLPYREHKIFNLNDGHKLAAPNLWDIVSEHGQTSWICGSMNSAFRPGLRGMLLPDPWATDQAPSHPELAAFYDFIKRHVMEYTSDRIPLTPIDYAKFGVFMATHGLSPESVIGLGLQLTEERANPGARWKRAAALDLLQFDVFKHYWKRLRPELATFFSNSTAHYQHYYWRNLDPEGFTLKPTAEDQAQHHDSILYGYRRMDALIGRFIDLVGSDTTLVFVTALSQQPYLLFEDDGGKLSYRPRDFDACLAAFGVTGYIDVQPVMTQNFHVRFRNEADAKVAAAKLGALILDGEGLLAVHIDGASLHVGCRLHGRVGRDATIEGCRLHGRVGRDATIEGGPGPVRFGDVLYQIEGVKSGMHHPDGMLWIRRPDRVHRVHTDKLPLTRVAPMILSTLSIAPPASMRAA
jgi:hypothetical protein